MASETNHQIRYEPPDPCPLVVSLGVGLQGVMMVLATMVLVVHIAADAGGQQVDHLPWAVCATLVIAGCVTALQAGKIWRFGSGHVLIVGPTIWYVAVSALAMAEGGPALLASLVVATSVLYIVLAQWLPRLRRLIMPTVGTVLMLTAVSVLPLVIDSIQQVPPSAPQMAGPVIAVITLLAVVVLSFRAAGALRLWSPLIAIAVGCLAAIPFEAYDGLGPVSDAPWLGLPESGLPGLDLTLGAEFWSLLPLFLAVALATGVKDIGDGIAIQHLSWRRSRATDFRVVQGSLNATGVGILLSGLAGTPPTAVWSVESEWLTGFTGVAARRVGYALGAILVFVSLLPKLPVLLLAVPSPVVGAYFLAGLAGLFMQGLRAAAKEGLDSKKAFVVGISFVVGVGLDSRTLGVDLFGDRWGILLDNGILAGALCSILLILFISLTDPSQRRARLEVELSLSAVPEIDEFLRGLASRIGWNEASMRRLSSASEEALIGLLDQGEVSSSGDTPRLIVLAEPNDGTMEIEFIAVFDEENLEDRLADLSEEAPGAPGDDEQGREMTLRLLRHHASSVRHQKYYGLDVVRIEVRAAD